MCEGKRNECKRGGEKEQTGRRGVMSQVQAIQLIVQVTVGKSGSRGIKQMYASAL
jgi:hypothetical protein